MYCRQRRGKGRAAGWTPGQRQDLSGMRGIAQSGDVGVGVCVEREQVREMQQTGVACFFSVSTDPKEVSSLRRASSSLNWVQSCWIGAARSRPAEQADAEAAAVSVLVQAAAVTSVITAIC